VIPARKLYASLANMAFNLLIIKNKKKFIFSNETSIREIPCKTIKTNEEWNYP